MITVTQNVKFNLEVYFTEKEQEKYKDDGTLKEKIFNIAKYIFEASPPDYLLVECSEYPKLED